MKRMLVLLAMVAMMSGCSLFNDDPDPTVKDAAVAAAQSWLKTIDEGGYAASWDTAAGFFKRALAQGQWEQSLTAVRTPLGALVSRDLISATYKTSLPGAPDGEYMVLQFKTSFENKRNAVETVTPMKDEDGAWRVSGYYIK